MKVFILMDGDYEEIQVDSIWSTKDLAQNRCNYLGRDYSDISTVEIDDFGIELLDNPAWSVRKYPGADAIYVEKRYGHVDLLEVDKVYFSNKLLPKIEHPICGVFLRAVIQGYSYLTNEIKAVVLAENENEAKEKFKELTADLGYCMTKEDIEKHILDWMQSPKRFTDSDVFDAGYFVIP